MFYIVYETTNLESGKYYIGVHHQYKNPMKEDGYYGSGKVILTLSSDILWRETLFVYDNKNDAYDKEISILTDDLLSNSNCYNMKPGGFGGWGGASLKLKELCTDIDWLARRNNKVSNSLKKVHKSGVNFNHYGGIKGNNFAGKPLVAGNFLFQSYSDAGRFYGVSDNAIRKRIKLKWSGYYGIS